MSAPEDIQSPHSKCSFGETQAELKASIKILLDPPPPPSSSLPSWHSDNTMEETSLHSVTFRTSCISSRVERGVVRILMVPNSYSMDGLKTLKF